jgi:hypothetical protein
MTLHNPLIDLLAARRITRLVAKDEITRPIRDNKFFHKHEKLEYLVNCPICVGVYTSAIVVVSSMLFPRASKPILYALALAEAQATFTELENQREALVEDYGPAL